MREGIASFLRDPMWQMIGAIVGIIALFVAFFSGGNDKKSVSVTHFLQAEFPDEWQLSKNFGLTHNGSPLEPSKVFFDYYIIRNDSKKLPVKESDFIERLTVHSPWKEIQIISVESCSLRHAELYTANGKSGLSRPYVQTEWVQDTKSRSWSGKTKLLNPGDVACVIVASQREGDYTEKDKFFPEWDARINGYELVFYKSQFAYTRSLEKELADYFYVGVALETGAIILFLIFFSLLFVYAMKKSQAAGYLDGSTAVYRRLLMIALASISTAEILADIVANRNGNVFSDDIHIVVWPLLMAHFVFLIYITNKAKSLSDSA
jgi:hypothetical protein